MKLMAIYKDIIISGGGIAGLTAAVAFGEAGFEVLCVDPTAPVTDRSHQGADLRTTAYLQPAQAFLQQIGLSSSNASTSFGNVRISD